ncbi:MAG TPA: FG-GAP-like repeat-containing protein [Terriglobales bacterium]|nr:FG-GAP-like repeat-containing protein [Terriglobales bacterium]
MPRCFSALITQIAILFVFAVCLCGRAAAQYFETRGDFPVGPPYEPVAIAIGDFNHDGKLDIAVTPYLSSAQISVMLGKGDGTFQTPTNYAVEQEPEGIATGDLNGDGNLDLVVTNLLSNSISVLLGNGDGTFQPARHISLHGSPEKVALADLNNDGNLDIVVVDQAVTTILGTGDGNFHSLVDNRSFGGFVTALTVGDFNHDGNMDVAICGSFKTSDAAGVLLGNGDGTLQPAVNYLVGFSPQSIVTADFNRDGNLDLAVAALIGGAFYVLPGNGDGTFRAGSAYAAGFPTWLAVGDFNRDGIPDVVVATSYTFLVGEITPFLGNGDRTFVAGPNVGTGKEPAYVATGDFNGDKLPDVLVADSLLSSVFCILNTGVLGFSPSTPLVFPPQKVGTTSSPQTVTLTNHGGSSVSISSIATTGDFHWSTTSCGSSLPAGASCQISVTFQPQKAGTQRGYLKINDSASSKIQVVLLSGQGTP